MAGGGYRGILAAVPTAQNLRSAFRRGRSRSRSKAKARRPDSRPDVGSVKSGQRRCTRMSCL